MKEKLKETKGITLVLLVVTIIVLLILAGISLNAVFNDEGIFSRAENAGIKYNEAKAKEVLETFLLGAAQYEKKNNPLYYKQEGFLDTLIEHEIPGAKVNGDIVIIGEYAFELNRDIPKIERKLGKVSELVFPEIKVSKPVITSDSKAATFTVTAIEEKTGINKIEIWLNGEAIESHTKTYTNIKTEITETYTVNRNGEYTVKAYANLKGSENTTVEGIIASVSFSPCGSTERKKQHIVEVKLEETAGTITEMKYVWVKDNNVNEPTDDKFTGDCLNNRTVTGSAMTGNYYLWVMLKNETGSNIKTNKYVSEAFNFDNEGPEIRITYKCNI